MSISKSNNGVTVLIVVDVLHPAEQFDKHVQINKIHVDDTTLCRAFRPSICFTLNI